MAGLPIFGFFCGGRQLWGVELGLIADPHHEGLCINADFGLQALRSF
jgi:hypothetical protein